MPNSIQPSLDLTADYRHWGHQQLLHVVVTQVRIDALNRVIESLGAFH
jgi:hypothetical protein